MSSTSRQPWLRNALFDLPWIIAPAYLSSVIAFLLWKFELFPATSFPLWVWVVCILGIDVSHVYSTLYRTYFDPEERSRYKRLLFVIPFCCWIGGVGLHLISKELFWSVLAYLAVFHFIRQQYGFFALYSRHEKRRAVGRWIDTIAIYSVTLYPLIYWHAHLPRKFVWFIPGDFAVVLPGVAETGARIIWITALAVFAIKETLYRVSSTSFNVPKNLFLWGTALSWYVGIVLCNADLPFTLTNVLSHGIPYLALVWLFERRKADNFSVSGKSIPRYFRLFSPTAIPLFLCFLFFCSYLEEALWDGLVWRDHKELFSWAWALPWLTDSWFLAVVVPLLALPQATHYVLDAFIWRIRKPQSEVRSVLEGEEVL